MRVRCPFRDPGLPTGCLKIVCKPLYYSGHCHLLMSEYIPSHGGVDVIKDIVQKTVFFLSSGVEIKE